MTILSLARESAAALVLSGAMLSGAMAPVAAGGLSSIEQAIVERAEARLDEALAFLEKAVNVNSDTMNPEGVRAVGAEFDAAFRALGFETEWEEMPPEMERAGHLIARRKGDRGNRLLLIGHLDTVFDRNGDFLAYSRDGDWASGPGVADMKGGDVIVLYALAALHEAGALDGADITVIFTGDEERPGRPLEIARRSLIEAAKEADIALNFEGGEAGIAVTSRRGSSRWRLTTTGVRAHSSGVFGENVGAGAIYEAARILDGFYGALRKEKGLTFNPGAIVGGTEAALDAETSRGAAFGKTNVVAQQAIVDGDLRFVSEAQKEKARETMRRIVARHLPHATAEIEFEDSYPAMAPTPGNAALLATFSAVSVDLGYGPVAANDPLKRGAADVSFVAPVVKASMDGLGVRGEGAHSPRERMEVASLEEGIKRAAILIHRLTREDAPRF